MEPEYPPDLLSMLASIIRTNLDALGFSLARLLRLVPLYEHEFTSTYDVTCEPYDRSKLRIVR